ncbi:MAG: hypothetical protein HC939_07815 [Pleurocapsa sp. SU_5_0]|nr:hypothetical protein [Pleurocapsa sp. SU_5_0]
MNQHSSTRKKYYFPLIGVALAAASFFNFSLPVFAAGTEAGQILRNTATGSYKDDANNSYTIESNTVDVTVAKVAGITNIPTGFDDLTSSATNTTVLTGDRVSFEFTISNVGNDLSNIFIPDLADISTKGLSRTQDNANFVIQVSPALTATGTHTFGAIPASGAVPNARPTNGIVSDVPINGKVIVKVTSTVSATAAGAPIEVRLGDTPPNTDPNAPVAATQNQPDAPGAADSTDTQTRDVRTEDATTPVSSVALVGGQKEASALQQVFLGANPLAMTRIQKTRGTVIPGTPSTDLSKNVIPYSLNLEVLNNTPNSLYTPGDLEGRDFASRITGIAPADAANLILVSDAIPNFTNLSANLTPVIVAGATWRPVYTTATATTDIPFTMQWTTTAPADLTTVKRVGWVYDARPTASGGSGPILSGTTVTGFTFNVITSGLDASNGGTVANVAQVFGGTVNGADIFDESGDQDPSNFNGANPGPNEADALSTGIANPATHGVDSGNDNNAAGADPASPGGEDSVLTIGKPGALLNGPGGNPTATGDIFGVGPNNDHDFQNLGVSNFPANAQHNATVPVTFDPDKVTFNNTLSNPGTTDLSAVLLQPINPEFDPAFKGSANDTDLPLGTTVKLTLGTQNATYTYQDNPATASTTDRIFVLTSGTPITIPTLAAGVPLDYQVEVDLPAGTGLSTDDAINGGFPVPIVAFVDVNNDGAPDTGDNRNLTVNQIYTGHIKVSKQVRVLDSAGTLKPGMNFSDPSSGKLPVPGDILEYRVIYRNISEPQVGSGNNGVLNGVNVLIDEDGTLDAVDGAKNGNNWGLDNNTDDDLDTINVQNSAEDTNNGTITFYTGKSTSATPINTLTSAGTTDPGDTVTGYRSTVPLLAPAGAEPTADLTEYNAPGDSAFTFQRKVDQFDGLGAEGLTP